MIIVHLSSLIARVLYKSILVFNIHYGPCVIQAYNDININHSFYVIPRIFKHRHYTLGYTNLITVHVLYKLNDFYVYITRNKTVDTPAINLRKFSSKFLDLCVDFILVGHCLSTHKCRNLLENLRKFLTRVSLAS